MKSIVLVGLALVALIISMGCTRTDYATVQASGNVTVIRWYEHKAITSQQLHEAGIEFTSISTGGEGVFIEFAKTPPDDILARIDSMLPYYTREGEDSLWEKMVALEARVVELEMLIQE